MSVAVIDGLAAFLGVLFPTRSGFLELRALPSRARIFVRAANPAALLARFLQQHADENCYVGAATRRTMDNGTAENCHELWTLYIDIDFAHVAEAVALERLARFPVPASVIVRTGGGVHAYWALKEPFLLPDEAEAAASVLRRLAQHFESDPAVAETARVLRVPGTMNIKYTPPRPVELIPITPGLRVNVSEVLEWLPADPERPTARPRVDRSSSHRISPGARNATLYRIGRALHARGVSPAATRAALRTENAERCTPPLPVAEVDAIAAHAIDQRDRSDFGGAGTAAAGVRLEDFYAYMPQHKYVFVPTRDVWPASSVNGRLPNVLLVDRDGQPVLDDHGEPTTLRPNVWLDQHRPIEQMTWLPGEPMVIRDRLLSDGGWIERAGCATFNLYRPPPRPSGGAQLAERWVEHVRTVYPDDYKHLLAWMAHRVQRPAEKINHALVLAGLQGVGKDTILAPVKTAVGLWNFVDVSPVQLLGRFNDFVKAVILRVSEMRDLGDIDRHAFYDHLKVYTAAPPDVLRVDEKNLREYVVVNVCGVVITTNYRTDGLYLPADDRRHYVAWSPRTGDDFDRDYWPALHKWYADGGDQHVAAYLHDFDLSDFDPKAPPLKTAAFWDVVDANRAPEDAELADVLDALGAPIAVTLADLVSRATPSLADWLRNRKSARQVPHRMEALGYVSARNDAAKDGLWVVNRRRQVIYVRHELAPQDRVAAARMLSQERG
jgi:hypothetical protein